MTTQSTTRLGDLLQKKGLVTAEQLRIAISTQTKRRQQLDPLDTESYTATSLGEILIELGFIDRLQLNCGLNWQIIVRKMALVMSLCAPLASVSYHAMAANSVLPIVIQAENYSAMKNISTETTTDVGGGLNVGWIDVNDWLTYATTPVDIPYTGSYKVTYRVASLNGGGKFSLREAGSNFTHDTISVPKTAGWQKWIDIERTITLTSGTHYFGFKIIVGGFNINWFKFERVSVASLSSSSVQQSKSSTAVSSMSASLAPPGSASASSKPASSAAQSVTIASSKPASSIAVASKPASSSRSVVSSSTGSAVSSIVSTQVAGPVAMSWTAPNLRENGSYLDITEVGGYDIRYKISSAAEFNHIFINDAWINFYNFDWLEGNYIFQIATFDKTGAYSSFVNVTSQ